MMPSADNRSMALSSSILKTDPGSFNDLLFKGAMRLSSLVEDLLLERLLLPESEDF